MPSLSEFKVITMDCYGTLIDWETGIRNALQPLLDHNRSDRPSAELLSTFAELESAAEAAHPATRYPEILKTVHQGIADRLDLTSTPELDAEFGASVTQWPAFRDSTEALARLGKHFALVILSNVDRAGFAASNLHLRTDFDAVYTAEDIGSYKPDPRNFEYLLAHLAAEFGFGADDVLHVAQSLFHDHVPAGEIGLTRAWIDRQGLAAGGSWGATAEVATRPTTEFVFGSMAEFADAADTAFEAAG